MKHLFLLPVLLLVVLGVAGVALGEGDDSHGLQLLGVLLVAAGITYGVRTARRSG